MIDFHTHVQPSIEAADEFFSWINPARRPHQGDISELMLLMGQVGITRSLIVPWLPAQDIVTHRIAQGDGPLVARRSVIDKWFALNDWAASTAALDSDRISALVGVDPVLMDCDEVRNEVSLRLSEGASGIKVAPMFINARPDDPLVKQVWDLAREHDVFILFESGTVPFANHRALGNPHFFEDVCRNYPDVKILLAHLGRGAEQQVAKLTDRFPNVYADLSLRLNGLGQPGAWTREQLVNCIRAIGIERVIYGTNYPLVDVTEFRECFERLGLSREEHECIGSYNAIRLLKNHM